MLKTWTSKYPPILKLACPQAINQIKLMSHVGGNIKNSQQVQITIFIYPKLYTLQSQHISNQHILLLLSTYKTSQCVCIYVERSHSRGKEITQSSSTCKCSKKIPKVCYAFQINSIQVTKIKRSFIRLIMGLGGNDNWEWEEFLGQCGG